MTSPRWLYLHGFASGPDSSKGRATTKHFAPHGVLVERLDLRVPSFEQLRTSAMMTLVRARIGGEADRAVLFGSSLGGYVASRVAERDARVCALVLMAPALRLVPRWRERLGAEWDDWRTRGFREVDDYARGGTARVDYGFVEDLEALEAAGPSLPDVRVPTLIVHGVQDDVVPIEGSRAWVRGQKHLRLIEVDDGHELTRSVPRILDEAERFLSGFLGGG